MKHARYLLVGATLVGGTLVGAAIAKAPDAAPKPSQLPTGKVTGTVSFFKDGKPQTPPTDAYVYLKSIRRIRPVSPKPRTGVEIRQKGKEFSPAHLVVPVGTWIDFVNDDNTDHNVFSSPWDPNVARFNLLAYAPGAKRRKQFVDAAEYDIYCDIHFQMKSKVKVVDSDLIGSIVDGKFTVNDVPPGTYKLIAWAPNSEEVKEPMAIVVTSGQTVAAPADLHLQLGAPKPHNSHYDGRKYDAKDVQYPRP